MAINGNNIIVYQQVDNAWVAIAATKSDEIQVYRFDRAACSLEPAGAPIKAWRPLCFKFKY